MGARERWTYDSVLLPVVNVYKYLGVLFSTKLSSIGPCYDLTSKAKNAVLCVMQKVRMLNNNSFELFVSQVQPIAFCGAVRCYGILRQQLFIVKRYIYLR